MRAHISFDLYVPEGVCTFEELQDWFAENLQKALEARMREWTLSNVDVEER